MDRFRLMGDPFLRMLSPERARVIEERISRWELPAHEFEQRLDRWFGNFEAADKELAFDLFSKIDFYGPARFDARLGELGAQVGRRARKLGLAQAPVLIVVPDGGGDSAHRHSYDLAKAWSLPRSQIVASSDLTRMDVTGSLLVLFNDTYGSGTQLLREVWPSIGGLARPPRAVFLAAAVIAEEALARFAKELPGVHVVPDTPAANARTLFSASAYERIRELGAQLCPKHPLGFGGTAILSAFYFQCPNNSLPLIWADDTTSGSGYPWSPLFRYRPKLTEPLVVTPAVSSARETPTAPLATRAPEPPRPAASSPSISGGTEAGEIRDPTLLRITDRVFGREDDLRTLKQRIGVAATLGAGALRAQVVTAVRGMAGVGKTTFAAWLADDPEVRSALPGGVLWSAMGEAPQISSELGRWGLLLGDERPMREPMVRLQSAQIAALLGGRRCLLLVDDVWESRHVAPFIQACPSGSVLVVTTREPAVARSITETADARYELPVLTPRGALEMLEHLAPGAVSSHRPACEELLARIGYLPIAVKVAGKHLQAEAELGLGLEDALRDLESITILSADAPMESVDLDRLTTPTVASVILRSVDRLDPQERGRFARLGSLPPKPATFTAGDLGALWALADPRPTARALVARGLLEPLGDGRFQIHALLAALARGLLT